MLISFSFVLVAVLLTGALLRPDGILPVQSNVSAVYKIKTNTKVAALTFDVVWGNRVPGPVLDLLKKHNVKATFFVSESWARQYPELARRITTEGHEIGSNIENRVRLSTEAKPPVKDELVKSSEAIKDVTGASITLFRAPYGDWNDEFLAAAAESGFKVIRWSVDSLDIQTPGKNNIVDNVVKQVHPGAIILMNASDTAAQTPEALQIILEELKGQGYELVTISSLMKMGPSVID